MNTTIKSLENLEYEKGQYNYLTDTMDNHITSNSDQFDEVTGFNQWVREAKQHDRYPFELARSNSAARETIIESNEIGKKKLIDMSSYNYLGLSDHPDVIKASQEAVIQYGIGAAGSPVLSGTLDLHQKLERTLLEFLKSNDDQGITLYTTGYNVSLGVISSLYNRKDLIVIDSASHMCIREAVRGSGAKLLAYRHNDIENLESMLKKFRSQFRRTLICTEGVFSVDGDKGKVTEIVELAKKYNAKTLVDEAHSIFVGGPNGKGIAAEQGVLQEVDFFIFTFSKAIGGMGGAVIATKEICQYLNWYSKCRMFSCALPPGLTAGMTKVVEIAGGSEGDIRRDQLLKSTDYFINRLTESNINIGDTNTWIVPYVFGNEAKCLPICRYFIEEGLLSSVIQFPAVAKGSARTRFFITSEHRQEDLDFAIEKIKQANQTFIAD